MDADLKSVLALNCCRGWYGPYGVRPGIERPDDDMRADIINALEEDPGLDPSEIDVRVDHGVVALSGEVDSESARKAAHDDAWSVPGVVDVHNDLQVRNG